MKYFTKLEERTYGAGVLFKKIDKCVAAFFFKKKK